MWQKAGWRFRAIPLVVHGDKVEYKNRDSLFAVSFSMLLAAGSTWDTKFFIWAFPESIRCKAGVHGFDT